MQVVAPPLDDHWAAITMNLPLQLLCLEWVERHGTSYVRKVTDVE